MIVYEYKKLINLKSILFLFVLIVINCAYIIQTNDFGDMESYYQGYQEVVSIVEGPITQQNVDFIYDERQAAIDIVQVGNYETEVFDESTYTGYIYADMNMLDELYQDLQRVYLYGSSMDEKITVLEENIEKNIVDEEYYTALINILSNRQLTEYYDTMGVETYINYSFSSLLLLFFIVMIVSKYMYYEKDNNMDSIILTTSLGRRKLKEVKIIIIFIFISLVTVLFSCCDFIMHDFIYQINGLSNPIYSLSSFASTSLTLSIFQFIILQTVLKIMGFLFVGLLIAYLVFYVSNQTSVVISILLGIFMIQKIHCFYQIPLITSNCDLFLFFNFYIDTFYWQVVMGFVSLVLLILMYRKKVILDAKI
ncbi:hypothetical protein [Tannockella kyphosi]|uniref:hypothetical protein n=1 Tax=Tannockella kyphosi TaxID=2899121 RepID=UPI0020121B20|nr:hypothetical protein [Tannockella kyphosi]